MSKRKKYERRRKAAINAAAIAFASGTHERIDELWALTVFFERYLERGARGTLKQFGPETGEPAKILRLVPKQ